MRWPIKAGAQGRGLALSMAFLLAGCGGGIHQLASDTPVKIGRPYTVNGRTYYPSDNSAYDQIGEASWYGSYEQGHKTASGEKFLKQRVSAAHTTLPLPSYVEVTRLDTGQRMLVRVNDRGPYARDRIIDLSKEAAHQLGIDMAGRAMVRVRRVQPTARQRERLRRGYAVDLASVSPTATPPRTGRVAPAQASTVQQPAPVAPAPSYAPAPYAAPYAPPPQSGAQAPSDLAPALPYAAPSAVPAPAYAPPAPQPRPAYRAPPVAAGGSVVVATPSDPDAADALAASLSGEGARVVATGSGYRVIAGPYPDQSSLSAALARLRARGYQGATAITTTP
jgi:rare lipoprotein A